MRQDKGCAGYFWRKEAKFYCLQRKAVLWRRCQAEAESSELDLFCWCHKTLGKVLSRRVLREGTYHRSCSIDFFNSKSNVMRWRVVGMNTWACWNSSPHLSEASVTVSHVHQLLRLELAVITETCWMCCSNYSTCKQVEEWMMSTFGFPASWRGFVQACFHQVEGTVFCCAVLIPENIPQWDNLLWSEWNAAWSSFVTC